MQWSRCSGGLVTTSPPVLPPLASDLCRNRQVGTRARDPGEGPIKGALRIAPRKE